MTSDPPLPADSALTRRQVYERARQYRGDAPISSWLRRLAVSSCLDLLRRRRVRSFLRPWRERNFDASTDLAGEDAEDSASYRCLRASVDGIVSRLPARQRAIFSLRIFEEWSLSEIAQSLGVSSGTVKTHLFRAVHRVRGELAAVDGALAPGPTPTAETAVLRSS